MDASKTKILIIDDEKEFTDLLQMNLRIRGPMQLRVVNHSDEAVEVARQFSPDVILLDIIMPAPDGCDVLRTLETDPELKEIPIIIVSALVTNDETTGEPHPMTSGRPVVAKPVKIARLVGAIEDVVGHSLTGH